MNGNGNNTNKKYAVIGLIVIGIGGMAAMVVLALTPNDQTATLGQIVLFAGTIVTAFVALLKGTDAVQASRNAEEASKDASKIGLDNSARIDEVHAKVNSGTATIMTTLGHPTSPDNPITGNGNGHTQ